ncbi:MAG: hypothetical protein OXB99_08075 [Acidimicrobiaceae bacterium]|nr:hypothetical protein [Acidimicrobiaceae bacterium]
MKRWQKILIIAIDTRGGLHLTSDDGAVGTFDDEVGLLAVVSAPIPADVVGA